MNKKLQIKKLNDIPLILRHNLMIQKPDNVILWEKVNEIIEYLNNYKIMKNQCNHKFIYSHSETITNTTTDFREYDVVICKECGKVRRIEKSKSYKNDSVLN